MFVRKVMSNSELITLYSIYEPTSAPFAYERDKFYDDQIEINKTSWVHQYGVGVINVFIVNRAGEVIIQKRSGHKRHNPNLLDKSIGWHVQRWDTVDYTVMVETVQELQVPSVVIRKDDDFYKRYDLLKDYLNTIAILKQVDTKLLKMPKLISGELMDIYNMTNLFFGVYGWSVKNVDKEAKWVLYYDIDELYEEMKTYPWLFTQDMHFYINEYEDQFREFIDFVRKE